MHLSKDSSHIGAFGIIAHLKPFSDVAKQSTFQNFIIKVFQHTEKLDFNVSARMLTTQILYFIILDLISKYLIFHTLKNKCRYASL